MKIFFYAAQTDFPQQQKIKQMALDFLLRLNVQVISTENADFLGRYEKIRRSKLTQIGLDQLEKLNQCDAVIIENTVEDFLGGYITNLAASKQIPVLLLNREGKKTYYPLIDQTNIQQNSYGRYSLITIMRDFIVKTRSKELIERLHFRITSSQKKFIQAQAESKKISFSRYIRELIDRDMG